MAQSTAWDLPPDLVESQLAIIELIKAMYPPTDGDTDNYPADDEMDRVRAWCDEPQHASGASLSLPPGLHLTVTIPIEPTHETSISSPSLQLKVTVPLKSDEKAPTEPPQPVYTLRQPSWLSRAEAAELSAGMPTDDVLAVFDYVTETAPKYLQANEANSAQRAPAAQDQQPSGPLLRVWFYFPSLSTREKRKDLVNYAPRYRLTGFVLAGKPGMLCLEGTSRDVDDYMNAIKNESWGDIPSHQKKVSERFREECGEHGRKFKGMSEITDDLGEKRGARKNRGDMAALESFLKEKGMGESFSKVIMGA
ncbi:hypothetical protein BD289DRAFT_448660 [Coniella lustricola]|uniref:Small nuclear ribonucleoprotein Prp3 C-terminal domain-containing protein n=1 Tax=Coniella lustricola TaxID=2025994 RepID=A0A2T2ZRY4_9PEZI|nr:hypothetical protein BD289DRAFT_448660 [Coniella lustricola]